MDCSLDPQRTSLFALPMEDLLLLVLQMKPKFMYGMLSVEISCFPWTMVVSVMNLALVRRIILKSIAEGSNVCTVVVR